MFNDISILLNKFFNIFSLTRQNQNRAFEQSVNKAVFLQKIIT